MLTKELVHACVRGGRVIPRYLSTQDHAWVEALQDILDAAVGHTRSAVEERLRQSALPGDVAARARKGMTHLLKGRYELATEASTDPRAAREAVFLAAGSDRTGDRAAVVARAASDLDVSVSELESSLYADLPSRRILRMPAQSVTVNDAIARYNLALAQTLLLYAQKLRVAVRGNARSALRFARLHRLLVQVDAPSTPDGWTTIEVSGPLSLFRYTLKYGRAMARWLPALTRLPEWKLAARCRWRDEWVRFVASHHDPLGTTHAVGARFDSKVEERFFRALKKKAPRITLLREAAPVQIGRRVVCPDFTLVDERSRQRVDVEIVGFWTPEYLADKLTTIRALPTRQRWVLCVDEALAAAAEEQLRDELVFWFRKSVDVDAFLRWLSEAVGWQGSSG